MIATIVRDCDFTLEEPDALAESSAPTGPLEKLADKPASNSFSFEELDVRS
jgi:hypothetical protein